MSRTTELLTNLFDWIWSVSAMGAVTVVLILLIQRILRKRLKPRWHYFMWLLVIIRLLLPWGPESVFSIYNWISYPDSIHAFDPAAQQEAHTEAIIPESAGSIVYRYSMYIWLLGIGALGTYMFVINRKFALKITKETRPITDIGVLQLFSECQSLMSVHKPVALVVSNELAAPALVGYVNPRLVMPQAVINSMNREQIRHVFLHELAHCKRNDVGINWLMQILLILHWFNPVLWYAYHRMREDQEIASDALALTYLEPDKRQNYGYTLIQLLETYAHPVSVPGSANLLGSKSQLQRRIIMIKHFQTNSYRWSFVGLAAILIISGCSLTNAKVNQNPMQSSNPPALEQKTTAIADTSPITTETDKKTDSAAAIEPRPNASSDSAVSAPEQKTAPADPALAGNASQPNESRPAPVASASAGTASPPSASVAAPQERSRSQVSTPSGKALPSEERRPAQVAPGGTASPPRASVAAPQEKPNPAASAPPSATPQAY